jgi:hypothetical protein
MVTKKNLEGSAGFLIKTRIGEAAKICLNQSFLAGHASLHIQNIEHFFTFEHIQYIEHFLTFEHIENIEHFFISAELEAFRFWLFYPRVQAFRPLGRPSAALATCID